jgi:hypothetical protein
MTRNPFTVAAAGARRSALKGALNYLLVCVVVLAGAVGGGLRSLDYVLDFGFVGQVLQRASATGSC